MDTSKHKRKDNFSEIRFSDTLISEPDQLLSGWHDYFENLYSFTNDNQFDNDFKIVVDASVVEYLNSNYSWSSNNITSEVKVQELLNIVKTLPNSKSPSLDSVTYEYVNYCLVMLINCLCKLFTPILHQEKVPTKFKQSLTITPYKVTASQKLTLITNAQYRLYPLYQNCMKRLF